MSSDQSISFEIIAAVGEAKGCYIESIRATARGELDEAERLIAQGNEAFGRGHAVHASILQAFASGEPLDVDILLVHAECQMMSAEDFQVIAEQALEIRRERDAR